MGRPTYSPGRAVGQGRLTRALPARSVRSGAALAGASGWYGSRPRPQQLAQLVADRPDGDAPLLRAVALADGDRVVLGRLPVDGDAEGRARLVLATVAAADGPLVIVEDVEIGLQLAVQRLRPLRHAVLVDQRE